MTSPLDDTHDPALTSWVDAANDPATDFPIQNLPFGRFRRAGDAHFRIGVAIGDQVVDVAAGRIPRDRRHERVHAHGTGPARRAAPHAVAPPARRQLARGRAAPVPRADGVRRDGTAVPDRRLHRFLHEHPPRDGRRPPVPARQSAAAELQVGADRLPRPRVVGGRQRPVDSPSGRAVQGTRCRGAGRRSDQAPRLRARARHLRRAAQRAGRARADLRRRGAPLRPDALQRLDGARHPGVGVPAARTVPVEELRVDACRRGSSRWRRSRRFARRSRAPPATRAAAVPRFAGQSRGAAPSTSRSRCGCRRPACATPACRRSG